jgi:hypothetical protein
MHRPPEDFLDAVARQAPECEVLIPEVGVRVDVPVSG